MKLGIVSDSHGKVDRLRRAVQQLCGRGAEALVHCGDIGSPECIDVLAGAGLPAYAVAGNMDRHLDQLQARAARMAVRFSLDTILVPIGREAYLAATHGSTAGAVKALVDGGRFAFVCHGHTHRVRNELSGGVRIINPGALRHVHVPTVALLDTQTGIVEHIRVK